MVDSRRVNLPRALLALLPLLALLGLPVVRQIAVCTGDGAGHGLALMHWAGDCPCEPGHVHAGGACVEACAPACDCTDVPLSVDEQIAVPASGAGPLAVATKPIATIDLAFTGRPQRAVPRVSPRARPPPLRAASLTQLAFVRLLI